MPSSKNRTSHKNATHQKSSVTHPASKKTNKAAIVVALFFGLLGLGISFFINGPNAIALLVGALVGVIAGAIFGYLIAKNLSKK